MTTLTELKQRADKARANLEIVEAQLAVIVRGVKEFVGDELTTKQTAAIGIAVGTPRKKRRKARRAKAGKVQTGLAAAAGKKSVPAAPTPPASSNRGKSRAASPAKKGKPGKKAARITPVRQPAPARGAGAKANRVPASAPVAGGTLDPDFDALS